MAEAKTQTLEREYVIPLRREFLKMPRYRRGGRATKTIKEFIAKHMKVEDRDTSKVKLDIYLNNEVLFRGRKKPLSKVKVKAVRDGDLIKVSLAESPEHVKFLKLKHIKRHAPSQKKATVKEEKKEEKTEEEKKEEKEKEQAVAEQNEKQLQQQAKAQKHLTKVKEPKIQRKALKK